MATLSPSQTARNAGQAAVLNHQGHVWQLLAGALTLIYIKHHGPCLMEAARAFCMRVHLEPPTHPNAWGALTAQMAIRGEIEMTGQWLASEDVRSHARLQPVWRAR